MKDINRVVLVGRLTRDAELRYTGGGTAVCKFSVAINRSRKNGDRWEDEANFFDIVLFGKQGEAINQYLVKGKQVGIDGELKQDRWEKDGQPRSKVEIVALSVQLLASARGGAPQRSQGETDDSADSYSPPNDAGGEFEDDIPF